MADAATSDRDASFVRTAPSPGAPSQSQSREPPQQFYAYMAHTAQPAPPIGFGAHTHTSQLVPQGPQPYYQQRDVDSASRSSSSKGKQRERDPNAPQPKSQKTSSKSSAREQHPLHINFVNPAPDSSPRFSSVASFRINGYVNEVPEQGQLQVMPHYLNTGNPPNASGVYLEWGQRTARG